MVFKRNETEDAKKVSLYFTSCFVINLFPTSLIIC